MTWRDWIPRAQVNHFNRRAFHPEPYLSIHFWIPALALKHRAQQQRRRA